MAIPKEKGSYWARIPGDEWMLVEVCYHVTDGVGLYIQGTSNEVHYSVADALEWSPRIKNPDEISQDQSEIAQRAMRKVVRLFSMETHFSVWHKDGGATLETLVYDGFTPEEAEWFFNEVKRRCDEEEQKRK